MLEFFLVIWVWSADGHEAKLPLIPVFDMKVCNEVKGHINKEPRPDGYRGRRADCVVL